MVSYAELFDLMMINNYEGLDNYTLELIKTFWQGVFFATDLRSWEECKEVDRGYYLEVLNSIPTPHGQEFMREFNRFVHTHYDRRVGAMLPLILISKNTKSEQEAFYKYFEMLDEFLKNQD